MSNYNTEQILHCKFCGRECKNINSLKQHECRCKENPNKLQFKHVGWPKGKTRVSSTKGKIWINNGIISKIVFEKEFNDTYKPNGWIKGVTKEFKEKFHNSKGIASSPELEKLRRERISNAMKKNSLAGGYRKGSGRGHKGWYKGIFCDSSWELAFVIYYKEHNLPIKRCTETRKYIWNNEEHTYHPDFITDDGIIEIKGYNSEQWLEKYKQNIDIKVLFYNDLKKYIDYCIEKYGKKYWEELYE